ncbi:flagellar assembly protein FliX [Minwuia sp.]|uniref:flagellar assembly protein FliX n=1 Tax=Minwuia sp. TaxID=2493630 RepID=UPI003A95CB63
MKIESQRLNAAAPVRRTTKRDGREDSAFALDSTDAGSEPARLTGLSGASAIGAVLLAQEEDTPAQRQQRRVRRADDLLDRLDEIRLSLLAGRIDTGKLENLKRALTMRLDGTEQPALQETLDAIDLRVAVELAKYHS